MKRQPPSVFLLDVDGVMTTGHFLYDADGKAMKVFGPDDHDALQLLRPHLEVRFITADHRGLAISKRRIVDDMGFPLDLVANAERLEWIRRHYPLDRVVYMADGILDPPVLKAAGYAIAPANADAEARRVADYVTRRAGGERAVAEASLHLLKKFFTPRRKSGGRR